MHDEPSISGLMAGRTRKWREESRHVFRGEFKVQSGSSHLFVIGITAPSVPETAPAGLDGVEGYSVV
jgi:hypothetical protein